jgi:hypothetical protein
MIRESDESRLVRTKSPLQIAAPRRAANQQLA